MLNSESLILDGDGSAVCIDLIPSKHHKLELAVVRSLVNASPYAQFHLLTEEITSSLKELQGRLEGDDPDAPMRIKVAERLNGRWELKLATDHMSLQADLICPHGGEHASFSDLVEALKEIDVTKGLLRPAITALQDQAKKGSPGATLSANIARGKPPKHGKDAWLERLVTFPREQLLKPQDKGDGKVDLRELGANLMVGSGDILMRRHPPEPGVDGYTLTGKVLPAKKGKDIKMSKGKGSEFDAKDPDVLRAVRTGQPTEIRNGIDIDEVLTLPSVDTKQGNVNYSGSVVITGPVTEGMKITASGNITVAGFIDGATLEAGGDIVAAQGVVSRQREDGTLSGRLKAGGQINAKFVQYTELECAGDIIIERQLVHCKVKCKGSLRVGDEKGRKGDLIGGEIRCSGPIQVAVLGAKAGTQTKIFVGDDIASLKSNLDFLNDKIKTLGAQSLKLKETQRNLAPLPSSGPDPLEKIRKQLEEALSIIADKHATYVEQAEELEQAIERFYDMVCVTVKGQLFPRVEVGIGPIFGNSKKGTGPCRIMNQDGKFVIEPLTTN